LSSPVPSSHFPSFSTLLSSLYAEHWDLSTPVPVSDCWL
jgi:hypothetical protein